MSTLLHAADPAARPAGATLPGPRPCATRSTIAVVTALGAAAVSLYALAISHRHDPTDDDVNLVESPQFDDPELDDPGLIAEIQDEMTRTALRHHYTGHHRGVGPSIIRAEPDRPVE